MKSKLSLKCVLLLLSLVFISSHAFAQLKKGTFLTEANFGDLYYSQSASKYVSGGIQSAKYKGNYLSFSLYPTVGIFLTERFVLGAELDILYSSSKSTSFDKNDIKSSKSNSSSLSLGLLPFGRYYFWKSGDEKSMFYAQLGGGIYGNITRKNEYTAFNTSGEESYKTKYDYPKKYNSLSGNVMVGWNRFLTENIAFNVNLGYEYTKTAETYKFTTTSDLSSTTSSEFKSTYTSGNIRWGLGLTMFIPRK